MDIRTLNSADGMAIRYRRWLPAGRVRSALVIVHGIADHSGRYATFATALVEAGHAAYAVDLRGHGLTAEATGVGETGPPGIDGVINDVAQLVELARSESSGTPVFVFGHSIGAVIVQAFVQRHHPQIGGMILCGSPGSSDSVRRIFEGFRGSTTRQYRARSSERYDWLSRDVESVRAYAADPFCGDNIAMSYRYVVGLVALTMRVMRDDAVAGMPATAPILLLSGEEDLASSNAANVRRLHAHLTATGQQVTARYYPQARHDLLHEVVAEQVQADILSWIGDHLA